MTRFAAVCLAWIGAACAAAGPRQHWDAPFHPPLKEIAFGVGERNLDASLAPNDRATAFSFDYQEGDALGPFDLEGGVHWAVDRAGVQLGGSGVDLTARVYEVSAGLRLAFDAHAGPLVPYVGVGGSLVFVELERASGLEVVADEDSVFGSYAKAGLLVRLRNGSFYGLEARGLQTSDLILHGNAVSGDSFAILFVFGAQL